MKMALIHALSADITLRCVVVLLAVAGAERLHRLGLGPGKGRQEHSRQDGDDGDDHQQFDQGESAGTATVGGVHGSGS